MDAEGQWEFTISPFTSVSPAATARDFNVRVLDTTGTYSGAETGAISGRGPDAIAIKTDGRVVEISATGGANIIIWAYSATTGEGELLVNESQHPGTFTPSKEYPEWRSHNVGYPKKSDFDFGAAKELRPLLDKEVDHRRWISIGAGLASPN